MFKFTTPPCDPPLAQVNRATANRWTGDALCKYQPHACEDVRQTFSRQALVRAVYRLPGV